MTDSLISNERRCVVCHREGDLHLHHIYGGANRRLSTEDGCWCWLCPRHHNLSNEGVHFDRQLDLIIKKTCQRKWEEVHDGGREAFIRRFGKSYL